jgi:hypothetical protein
MTTQGRANASNIPFAFLCYIAFLTAQGASHFYAAPDSRSSGKTVESFTQSGLKISWKIRLSALH